MAKVDSVWNGKKIRVAEASLSLGKKRETKQTKERKILVRKIKRAWSRVGRKGKEKKK